VTDLEQVFKQVTAHDLHEKIGLRGEIWGIHRPIHVSPAKRVTLPESEIAN